MVDFKSQGESEGFTKGIPIFFMGSTLSRLLKKQTIRIAGEFHQQPWIPCVALQPAEVFDHRASIPGTKSPADSRVILDAFWSWMVINPFFDVHSHSITVRVSLVMGLPQQRMVYWKNLLK